MGCGEVGIARGTLLDAYAGSRANFVDFEVVVEPNCRVDIAPARHGTHL